MQNDLEKLYEPIKRKVADSLGQWMQEGQSDVLKKMKAVAKAMEAMSEELQNEEEPEMAELARSGSDSIKQMSSRMENVEPERYFSLIEEQGQSHPAGAFVASLALGFTTSRAARTTYESESQSSNQSDSNVDPGEKIASDDSFSGTAAPIRDSATGSAAPPQEAFEPTGSRASGQDFRS